MPKLLLPVLLVSVFATGCTITSSRTVVEFDGSKTDYTKLDKMKKGEACMEKIVGFPTKTDGSIATAATNGGISKVKHVDQQYKQGPLNFTESLCTVVYGK